MTEYLYHKVVLIGVFDLFPNIARYISKLEEYLCVSQVGYIFFHIYSDANSISKGFKLNLL